MTPHAVLLTAASVLAAGLVLAPAATRAERADRDKPTVIEGDDCVYDELKQIRVCTGRVFLIRGTLRLTGEKMEVREDADGYRSAVLIAAGGALATFRQRRDATQPGVEEVVEGAAERIEYDERTETIRFITRAQWKRLENEQPRDELAGSLIVYDGRTRVTRVDGKAQTPDGRVRILLAPTGNAPTTGTPVPLQPARPPAERK
jgi:lipopolysaccharide export system protein LptA